MPEKNFEQQVQHTLDELRVVPGGKVWQEVEASLKKDRRRRILIFWLPLTGILLLGIGLAVYLNQPDSARLVQQGEQQPVKASEAQHITPGKNAETPAGKSKELQEKIDLKPTETVIPEKENTGNNIVEKPGYNANANETVIGYRTVQKNRTQSERKKKEWIALDGTSAETVLTSSVERKMDVPSETSLSAFPFPRSWAPVSLYSLGAIPRMPLLQEGDLWVHAPYLKGPVHGQDTEQKKKWNWGIMAAGGLSGLSNGPFLSFSNQSLLMDNSAYQQSTTPPQTGRLPTDPSGVKPGITIATGFWISRTLNQRFSLLSGLEWRLIQNVQAVGNGYDSLFSNPAASGVTVLPGYYRAGDSLKYTNRYQYLELPLLLQYRLNKNAAKPLYAEAGITVQYLLKAKAMNFLPTNVFYAQTSGYTNWGLGLRLGLEWKAFRNLPLSLTPQFNWQLNNLRPEAKDPSRLWSIGMGLRYKLK